MFRPVNKKYCKTISNTIAKLHDSELSVYITMLFATQVLYAGGAVNGSVVCQVGSLNSGVLRATQTIEQGTTLVGMWSKYKHNSLASTTFTVVNETTSNMGCFTSSSTYTGIHNKHIL